MHYLLLSRRKSLYSLLQFYQCITFFITVNVTSYFNYKDHSLYEKLHLINVFLPFLKVDLNLIFTIFSYSFSPLRVTFFTSTTFCSIFSCHPPPPEFFKFFNLPCVISCKLFLHKHVDKVQTRHRPTLFLFWSRFDSTVSFVYQIVFRRYNFTLVVRTRTYIHRQRLKICPLISFSCIKKPRKKGSPNTFLFIYRLLYPS